MHTYHRRYKTHCTVNICLQLPLRHFSGDEAFLHNPNTFKDKKHNTTNSDVLKANYSPAPVRDGGRDEKL